MQGAIRREIALRTLIFVQLWNQWGLRCIIGQQFSGLSAKWNDQALNKMMTFILEVGTRQQAMLTLVPIWYLMWESSFYLHTSYSKPVHANWQAFFNDDCDALESSFMKLKDVSCAWLSFTLHSSTAHSDADMKPGLFDIWFERHKVTWWAHLSSSQLTLWFSCVPRQAAVRVHVAMAAYCVFSKVYS